MLGANTRGLVLASLSVGALLAAPTPVHMSGTLTIADSSALHPVVEQAAKKLPDREQECSDHRVW